MGFGVKDRGGFGSLDQDRRVRWKCMYFLEFVGRGGTKSLRGLRSLGNGAYGL